jgi:hypothetical protein
VRQAVDVGLEFLVLFFKKKEEGVLRVHEKVVILQAVGRGNG